MLTLNQYREINALSEGGVFERMIHTVSVVRGLDEYEVQEWDSYKLVEAYNNDQQKTKVSERYSDKIKIHDTELTLINFEALKLGQWIDLESMVSDDYIGNLHRIAACIYLQHSGGGMYSDEWEQYGKVNIEYRSGLIDQLPAQQTIGACAKYLKFRKNLFDSYELFSDPFEGVNVEELDDEERAIYNEEKAEREKGAKNQWERLLNILAQNDSTKFDAILDHNLFLALNQATYLKSLKT